MIEITADRAFYLYGTSDEVLYRRDQNDDFYEINKVGNPHEIQDLSERGCRFYLLRGERT